VSLRTRLFFPPFFFHPATRSGVLASDLVLRPQKRREEEHTRCLPQHAESLVSSHSPLPVTRPVLRPFGLPSGLGFVNLGPTKTRPFLCNYFPLIPDLNRGREVYHRAFKSDRHRFGTTQNSLFSSFPPFSNTVTISFKPSSFRIA